MALFFLVLMVNLAVVVLGGLLYGASAMAPAADSIFGPLFTAHDPDGPLVVVREQETPPLLAIRLSVPVEEPPDLAGAGRVLQLLVGNRLRSEVARFGGRIEFQQTPTHLVYLVSGPATAFGEMIAVLRYAVAPPPGVFRTHNAVWLTVRRESLIDSETPDRLVRHRLQAALFPEFTVADGDPGITNLPGATELEWFWRRWFQPTSMSVVVTGAIAAETARAAFRGWPKPPAAPARRPEYRGGEATSGLEILSARVGLGYPADASSPAGLAIAAALIEEALPALQLRQASAELWWLADQAALVLIGAAPAGSKLTAAELRTLLQICAANAAAGLSSAELARLRDQLRYSLLLRARSPAGMAAVIGEFMDRTGDPRSAESFFESLGHIKDVTIQNVLRTVLYRPPIVVQLEP